jgi:hypothetical protein
MQCRPCGGDSTDRRVEGSGRLRTVGPAFTGRPGVLPERVLCDLPPRPAGGALRSNNRKAANPSDDDTLDMAASLPAVPLRPGSESPFEGHVRKHSLSRSRAAALRCVVSVRSARRAMEDGSAPTEASCTPGMTAGMAPFDHGCSTSSIPLLPGSGRYRSVVDEAVSPRMSGRQPLFDLRVQGLLIAPVARGHRPARGLRSKH